MRVKPSQTEIHNAQSKTVVRASITFPPDLYEALEKIALQKKVSLAWVVRDAAEIYVTRQRPSSREKQK